jgi:hypothetical protein
MTVGFINRLLRSPSDPKHYPPFAHILAFCGPSQQIPIPKKVKTHFLAFRPTVILLLSTTDYTLTLTHSTTKPYLIREAHTT